MDSISSPVSRPVPFVPEPEPSHHEPAHQPAHHPPQEPWFKKHRKLLIISTAAVVLLGGGAAAWVFLMPKQEPVTAVVPANTPTPTPSATPTPLTKASPLTGVQVAPDVANKPVYSVIVENHPAARPQSGLSEAGVVYEALAEGGISRFQTFFLESRPASIGPVRSLRHYFLDWGLEFAAPVAHAGGSSQAISQIGPTGLKSLNALAIGRPTFIRAGDRAAPHNLYTSGPLMEALLASRKLNGPATFTPSPRKADTPSQAAKHPKITINYSYTGYQAAYAYDPATNSYARSLAGAPHVDRNSGKQIMVKNVVVEYMPTSIADAQGHLGMQTVGKGSGVVFRDGDAIPCTWVKDSRNARTKLIDAAGKEIPLNAGNTWYSIVPVGKSVTY